MKKSPNECLEEWEGIELQIGSSPEGCYLMIKNPIPGSGVNPRDPQAKPLVKMPEQREILVALIHKAGGSLKI